MGFLGDVGIGAAVGGPAGAVFGGTANLMGGSGKGPFAQKHAPDLTDPPPYAPYTKGWTPDMAISGNVENRLSMTAPNRMALNQQRADALRTGPSKWAGLQNQQQSLATQQAQQQAAADAMSGAAAARSQLASRGGLSGGASERISRDAMRNRMAGSQQARQAQAANMFKIGSQDESNRINQLQNQTGNELNYSGQDLARANALTGANQFDVGQQVSEAGRQNSYNMDAANDATNRWAAQQALAQQQWNTKNTGGTFGAGGFMGMGFGASNNPFAG